MHGDLVFRLTDVHSCTCMNEVMRRMRTNPCDEIFHFAADVASFFSRWTRDCAARSNNARASFDFLSGVARADLILGT